MDEEEVDSWYEDEKQKLVDEYIARLEKKEDRGIIEKDYNAKFGKLTEEYNKKMEKAMFNKAHPSKVRDAMEAIGKMVRRRGSE